MFTPTIHTRNGIKVLLAVPPEAGKFIDMRLYGNRMIYLMENGAYFSEYPHGKVIKIDVTKLPTQ